jgi:hypothetical protein
VQHFGTFIYRRVFSAPNQSPLDGFRKNHVMNEVVDHVTKEIGTEPVPYELLEWPGIKRPTNCLLWKLPPPIEQDKSILQLVSELQQELYELYTETPDSPEIVELLKKQEKLLEGVKVSKRHGVGFYATHDLLVLDKRKGIRKEWWNLRNYVKENGCCLFLGYSSESSQLQSMADEVILMPGTDQYEYVRLHGTQGNNFQIETEEIVDRIRKISRIVETTVLFAADSALELLFEDSSGKENLSALRYQLRKMCPDIEELTTSIKAGRVFIWWD